MKVAICISGHLRQFKKGYENLYKNIISENPSCNFDFFIETWETQDWRTVKMFESTENIIDNVVSLYNPVSINVEKDIKWDTSKYMKFVSSERWLKKGCGGERSKGQHILGMYYKIKKCNDQKLKYENINNFKYDVVIRHRTDLGFSAPISISDKLDNIDNIIYVPSCDAAARDGGIPIRDIFAISNSKNIDYYSSVFDNIDSIVEKSEIFRPEPILDFHLKQNSDISVIELDSDWFIIQE